MPKLKHRQINRIAKIQTNHTKIKLDLSYGDLPPGSGFEKVKGLDPEKIPWKLGDESVEEAMCAFRLNRIPGPHRMAWMAELWRVLIPNGKVTVIVPYWSSPRSIQDPESKWPPICDQSFLYFQKAFRDANKQDSSLLSPDAYCDFDFTGGYQFDTETAGKSDDVRAHWIKHYINAVSDLHIFLTKRPK